MESEVASEMERLRAEMEEGTLGRGAWNVDVFPEALRRLLKEEGRIERDQLRFVLLLPEGAAALFGSLPAGAIRATRLLLDDAGIEDEGAEAAARELEANTAIAELSLCGNDITDSGARHLASALRVNATLRRLDLRDNGRIGAGGVAALAEALAANSTLERLSLGGTERVSAESARALLRAVSSHRSLTDLSLRSAELAAEDARALVEMSGCPLRRLDLNQSLRNREALLAFLSGIGRAQALTHLDLSRNPLGDKGAAELASSVGPALVGVVLRRCGIGAAGATAIAAALRDNRSLASLDVSGNPGMGEEGSRALLEALKHNRALTALDMGASGLESATTLAEALKVNRSLNWLGLEHNAVVPRRGSDVRALVDAFATNTVLTTLRVTLFAALPSRTERSIDAAIHRNRALRSEAVAQREFLRSAAGLEAVPWIAPDVLVNIVSEYAGRAWSEREEATHHREGSHFSSGSGVRYACGDEY